MEGEESASALDVELARKRRNSPMSGVSYFALISLVSICAVGANVKVNAAMTTQTL